MAEIDLDAIHWTIDGNGDYMPQLPAKSFNYPAEPLVLAPTVFGYDGQYTGTLSVDPLVIAPVVVGVDDEDGEHATISVSAGDPLATHVVQVGWWGQNGVQEWAAVGTLIGNGSVVISRPQGLYACRAVASLAGHGESVGLGNLFWVSDATNLTRVRIRDNVSRSVLRCAQRLGFQAQYENPDRPAVTVWVLPDETAQSMGMLGGETGTIGLTVQIPRQPDFPPEDGLVPGARVGVRGVWFACDIRYPTESINLAPVFFAALRRLDVTVEVDGEDV